MCDSCLERMNCAGVQGMDLLHDYDYIAIFDADFKPEPDFLVRLRLLPCSCCCAGLVHAPSVKQCLHASPPYLFLLPLCCCPGSAGSSGRAVLLEQDRVPCTGGAGALPDRQPWHRVCAGALGLH